MRFYNAGDDMRIWAEVRVGNLGLVDVGRMG
jgi:hypothetical protein